MNVREIVREYLKKNGYDGLAGDGCGCDIEDLFPCGDCIEYCVPAYKRYCENCVDKEDCGYREEYECDFCYSSIKPEEKNE